MCQAVVEYKYKRMEKKKHSRPMLFYEKNGKTYKQAVSMITLLPYCKMKHLINYSS